MRCKQLLSKIGLRAVLFLFLAGQTKAAPVVYTFSGLAYGSVANSETTLFSSRPFTIQFSADTDDIYVPHKDLLRVDGVPPTIEIEGFGSGVFSDPAYVFVNYDAQFKAAHGPVLGLGVAGRDLLDMLNTEFLKCDLASSFGPTPALSVETWGQFQDVPTSLGFVTFRSAGPVTFNAQVFPVPEPSATSILIAAGCAFALVATGRSRRVG